MLASAIRGGDGSVAWIAPTVSPTGSSIQPIEQDLYGGSYQFTARNGDRSWGVTLSDGLGMSDSNGTGVSIRRNAAGAALQDLITEYKPVRAIEALLRRARIMPVVSVDSVPQALQLAAEEDWKSGWQE